MHSRVVGVYFAFVMLMTVLIYRIYHIDASGYIKMAAAGQGGYSLSVATTRGMIYDRNMNGLVNKEFEYVASVLPSPQAALELLDVVPDEEKPAVVERLSAAMPFAIKVPVNEIYAAGIEVFRIPKRYGGYSYAPHIVGYMGGGDIDGVSGIELSFNDELKDWGGRVSCSYYVDAAGHIMPGASVNVNRSNENPVGGVCLTLDREVQYIAQEALSWGCDKGAAIVMEVDTGNILAMASLPVFDQNNISASLDDDDAPFISRAVSGYNIGSVFKLVVSAAALEKGIPVTKKYICGGQIDVGGVVFRCNNNAVHGETDMRRALEVSCNTYFIMLAEELGPEYLLMFCVNMGFDSRTELAPGLRAQPGNLPGLAELRNPAALANFGFGQGSSLATPLQMAGVVSSLVNGGFAVMPNLVRGFTDDGFTLSEEPAEFAENRIIGESTSNTIKSLMISVVEDGSGRTAKPRRGGAGGKTSSAQTGQKIGGTEIVHAWFAGFYPAYNPKYSIVVFVEGGVSGEHMAAPIFKKICDEIDKLELS
ncbi:MAG: penicillin-binding protein 2 [Oscillospiraceae bacterium]|nr:penicillin-binding protein 2 [Oscillospiraceae bacterium]